MTQLSDTPCVPKDDLNNNKRTASSQSVDKVAKRQKRSSESTSNKAASSYNSAPTCSSSSEVQHLRSGFAPVQIVYAESKVINEPPDMRKEKCADDIKHVTDDGFCQGFPEDGLFDFDELMRVMDPDVECNNENKTVFSQIESVYVQQDPHWIFPDYFDFDSLEVGRYEESSFSPQELGLTWDELVQ